MRDFADIVAEYDLEHYLDTPLGNLYFRPSAFEPEAQPMIVRRFDGDWQPPLVVPYADVVRAAQHWIEQYPALARVVRVDQPLEVGRDFVAFKHHRHYQPTNVYVDDEDPLEPPVELDKMRAAFRAADLITVDNRGRLLATILARSILEPNYKTYFEHSEHRFIITELKITREEIERWAEVNSQAAVEGKTKDTL